jgi:hypothetical protein
LNGDLLSGYDVTSESGIDWTLMSIPEPSTSILLGFGLVALGASRRRH